MFTATRYVAYAKCACAKQLDGSRWNGWATPMFDRDTAMQVMRSVNDANEGEDDQIISYDERRDHLRGTCWQGMTVI